MYRLKLIRGRSYTGRGVKATAAKPFVQTEEKRLADYLVSCKRFALVDAKEQGAPKQNNAPGGGAGKKAKPPKQNNAPGGGAEASGGQNTENAIDYGENN